MKVAVYPGSFNPWHKGHQDILTKALECFDFVVVTKMFNPEKHQDNDLALEELKKLTKQVFAGCMPSEKRRVKVTGDARTLKELLDERFYIHGKKFEACAVVRGLRNGNDLQYEMNQQYWNEDVGVAQAFVYFITDRSLGHVSSSSIRMVNKLGLKHEY